jgi:arabinofuranan 3-O-arabinosyltransferase
VLPGQGGRVLRQGHGSRARREGVRVQIDGPSWLVLGGSYNRGWRARCNGRDLGAPQPLQGYANGWLVEPGCSRVDFRFGPDNVLRLAYVLSIFGIPFLIVAVVRRRRPGYTNLAPLDDPDPVRPLDLLTAVGVGAVGAVAVVAVFTPVAGVAAFPVLVGLLWRGARIRRLVEGATLLIAAGAPAAYGLADWDVARWFVAAGVCLLTLALARTLMAARAP